MSMESAKAFMEKIKTDEDFCHKVNECKDSESRITFVKSQGFDFTMEEVMEMKAGLSEEELESVAGGRKPCPNDCIQDWYQWWCNNLGFGHLLK